MTNSYHLIIPARLASKRLPGKPLKLINGTAMLVRVANTCIDVVGRNNVTVSTPDLQLKKLCSENKINVVHSSHQCESGTDRISEFAKSNVYSKYINVQGDEPLLTPLVLEKFLINSSKYLETVIGVCQIKETETVLNKNVVKVAISQDKLVYASRNPLPHLTKKNQVVFFKHTGLYSFTRENILNFNKFPRGTLEMAENIEILRLIERGISIKTVILENYGRSVDTQEDLEYVEKYGKF